MIQLNKDEVHLWYAVPDALACPEMGNRRHLLDEEEKAQEKRFLFEKDQRQYLAARILVRTILSHYASVEPERWQFSKNEYGRPEIAFPKLNPSLFFNLAHSGDCVACVVSRTREVGVDIEFTKRPIQSMDIIDRFFSISEIKALKSLRVEDQKESFFLYWTLKEAYIKARGMGLSLPLDQFSFHFIEGEKERKQISISFDSRMKDDARAWRFGLFNPTPFHQGAIAMKNVCYSDRILTVKRVLSLSDGGAPFGLQSEEFFPKVAIL